MVTLEKITYSKRSFFNAHPKLCDFTTVSKGYEDNMKWNLRPTEETKGSLAYFEEAKSKGPTLKAPMNPTLGRVTRSSTAATTGSSKK